MVVDPQRLESRGLDRSGRRDDRTPLRSGRDADEVEAPAHEGRSIRSACREPSPTSSPRACRSSRDAFDRETFQSAAKRLLATALTTVVAGATVAESPTRATETAAAARKSCSWSGRTIVRKGGGASLGRRASTFGCAPAGRITPSSGFGWGEAVGTAARQYRQGEPREGSGFGRSSLGVSHLWYECLRGELFSGRAAVSPAPSALESANG